MTDPTAPGQHAATSAIGTQGAAPTRSGLRYVHIDPVLLVLDKPAGLLAVPGRGEAGRDNLAAWVQADYPDALVVHRLDQATSGLMVLARGAAAQRVLSMAFEQRLVDKAYIAVVEGCLGRNGGPGGEPGTEQDSGRIDLPLVADWPQRPRQKVDHQTGRPSLTLWQRLPGEEPEGGTRLRLVPVTGRTHQLRVHLAHVGHPIRGDALYAPAPLRAARLLLHASELALPHPLTGERLRWVLPAPF